ncbi:MAG: class I SAM-dependent methyltransferase [Nitrospina sp.]|jgi:ubiquinone/menaquinone biosynthesis C-methylase UbiE|nr:class I SAM-dependent methyltransferase [Nitrospina sp.]
MEEYEYEIMYGLENTYWWFKGKQFLLEMLLNDHLDDDRSNRALDIGAGTGATLELLRKYGAAYGVEFSKVALRMLKQKGLNSIVRSDAEESIPFKDDTFSAVTCLDVLEHLENDSGLLAEMVRVCKPGGIILVTVPAMPFLWSRHDEALHHKRRYKKTQLLNRIAPLNCTVTRSTYYNAFLFLPIAAVRMFKFFVRAGGGKAESDFFMPLPEWLNSALYFLFATELKCLRIVGIPFGLSILAVIQKPYNV